MWQAIREVRPGAQLQGFVFHWTQALWPKTQKLGLEPAYVAQEGARCFIRCLMALPFLPFANIEEVFQDHRQGSDNPKLTELCNYIENIWLRSSVWAPTNWSVFNKSVQTNKGCEGWHRRLNHRSDDRKLPFYQLVDVLHKELRVVELQVRLLSENNLRQYQRGSSKRTSGRVFAAWDEYSRTLDCRELLEKCTTIYAPVIDRPTPEEGEDVAEQ